MNNKGIILSSLIYALLMFFLLLLVSLLAVLWYRQNAADRLSKDANGIYDDLYVSEFSKDFAYTGNYQTFVVPISGYYRIELWGASGGNFSDRLGGAGAYTSGKIYLKLDNAFYIYVGGIPSGETGGYNGGASLYLGEGAYGAAGGGATDIRLVSGAANNITSLRSRIMVAAGGGGANDRNSASQACGYGEGAGGSGGALTGLTGETISHTYNSCTYGWGVGTGATQTSGGYYNTYDSAGALATSVLTGSFGTADSTATHTQSGGGGGYYGGGNAFHGGAGGGSSFISGFSGCNAIDTSGNHTGQSKHYSGYAFTDGQMIAGNATMESPTGIAEMGHTGSGYARITYLP